MPPENNETAPAGRYHERPKGAWLDGRVYMAGAGLLVGGLGEMVQDEAAQTRSSAYTAYEAHDTGLKILETVATMPLDAKALGLGAAAATATLMVAGGRVMRDRMFDNARIAFGAEVTTVKEPLRKRIVKRAGTAAVAGVVALGAYKVGEHGSFYTDFAAQGGVLGAGGVYLQYMKKRMTGKWFSPSPRR